MRQAITTRFYGPTNHRGARVKATASAGSVTVPYDYDGGRDASHQAAAEAFADKFNWVGSWVGGGLPDGSCCWVQADDGGHDSFELTD